MLPYVRISSVLDLSPFSANIRSSGWSFYTSALAGETPCYTTSSLAALAPNVTLTASGASMSIINTEVFTLRYALAQQQQQSALSLGAKIGIAVGAAGGGALALLALAIFVRKRRAQKRAQREEANMPKPESGNMYQRGHDGSLVAELPSPQGIRPPTLSLPENRMFFNMPLGSHAPGRAMTPMELAGSTYINEHHPAYGLSPLTPNKNGFPDVPGPPEELAGDDPMRKTVSRETARTELGPRAEGTAASSLREESERPGSAG